MLRCSECQVGPQKRDEEGQPYFLGAGGIIKKSLSLIIPVHQEVVSTFPRLWLILCSCLAAPSPPLLLFKGLPVVLPRLGHPGQKHVSWQLWIATRAQSQGCLSLRRMQPRGLAKSPPEREASLSAPQALFSLKIPDHSTLPGLRNVCTSSGFGLFGVGGFFWVFVGFFFFYIYLFHAGSFSSAVERWGLQCWQPPQALCKSHPSSSCQK